MAADKGTAMSMYCTATLPSTVRNDDGSYARREGQGACRWTALMAAAQNGDAASYRLLLTEVSKWLRGYYARRLPAGMVEDAAQDTLIAIHTRRQTYDPNRPFKSWLVAVARYKWIDRLRALSRDPVATGLDDDLAVYGVGDHESSVTSTIVLADLLALLKPAQAAVIKLVKLEGFSIEEASTQTGQSVSLVKVNIHRGLAQLRRQIAN